MSAGRLAGFPNSLRLLTNLKNKKKILLWEVKGLFLFIWVFFFWLVFGYIYRMEIVKVQITKLEITEGEVSKLWKKC